MYHLCHAEKGEEDGHDDDSDDASDSDDDDGFHHAGEAFDGVVDLFVVAIGHLFEHAGEWPGLFADFDGEGDVDGETINSSDSRGIIFEVFFSADPAFDIFSTESTGERFPGFDFQYDSIEFSLIISIPHTTSYDEECPIDEDTGGEEGREELGESDEGFLAEDVSEEGDSEDGSVEFISELGFAECEREESRESGDTDKHVYTISEDEMTDSDDGLCKSGEIDICFVIDFLDFWDDVGHDGDNHTDGNHHDRNGIDKGLLDLAIEFELFFLTLGENIEDLSELTGRISHFEHSSVKWRENFWETCGDIDNIFPRFNGLFEIDSHVLNVFVLRLEVDNLDGTDNGDSRIDKTPKVVKEEDFFFTRELDRLHTRETFELRYLPWVYHIIEKFAKKRFSDRIHVLFLSIGLCLKCLMLPIPMR